MCLRSGFRRAIESVWPAMPVPEDLHETARLLAQTSAHALPRPRPMEELRVEEEEHDHRGARQRRVQLKCLTRPSSPPTLQVPRHTAAYLMYIYPDLD
jgi:hypothetical protein